MKQIVIGVLVFLVWLVISTYWYVCGIRDLCEQPKPQPAIVLLPQEEEAPIKEPEPKPEPVPVPQPKVEEKKEFILPAIYFIFEKDSVKNVDDLIASARMAENYLEEGEGLKLYITGHACNFSEENDAYALGSKRAEAVKKYMVVRGIPEDRIITVSKGSDEPEARIDSPEVRMVNRRVEMVVK
jgi:OOP family OmpA-OmpF porin